MSVPCGEWREWRCDLPGTITRPAGIGEVGKGGMDEENRVHKGRHISRGFGGQRKLLRDDFVGWMSFDDGRNDNAIAARAAATDGKEKVWVLAWRGCDDFSIGKDHTSFEDLVGPQAKIMGCRSVATALHPSSETTYRLQGGEFESYHFLVSEKDIPVSPHRRLQRFFSPLRHRYRSKRSLHQ